ncbi:MAG: BCCT family transporter [Phycisphaerae bacterium]
MLKKSHLQVDPTVFFTSAAFVLLFVILGVSIPERMGVAFSAIQSFIVEQFGWFYILAATVFLVFVLWLFFSSYGGIKLGKDDEEPEYSTLSWFAMLFSAGMGIGLVFWSVAEPMYHLAYPPQGDSVLVAAAADDLSEVRGPLQEASARGKALTAQLAALPENDPTRGALTPQAEAAAETFAALEVRQQAARDTLIPVAREAMSTTFFHWGLHAWSIYIVVGLSLAYFAYRHDLPLTIRSCFYPVLGRRIYGPIGDGIEIVAVLGTLFGVATSLGLGVKQIGAGLEYLNVLTNSTTVQIVLIAVITLAATVSVVSGLDVGIRRLSEANLGLSAVLLLFVFIAGPTVFLTSSFVQTSGLYLTSLVERTFRTDAYVGTEWQSGWTMYYWGWWISWSPFVGMFIARISRGRTIRSFIGGVLLAPCLLTFIWLTVFGNTGLYQELFGAGPLTAALRDPAVGFNESALFVMLGQLPLSSVMTVLAICVIALYFITSSDSASLVVDMLTNGGNTNPPTWQRVFWATTEGAVAAALLLAGGLAALQTAAITTGLPVAALLLVMCYALVKGLRAEHRAALTDPPLETVSTLGPEDAPDAAGAEWPQRLAQIIGRREPALAGLGSVEGNGSTATRPTTAAPTDTLTLARREMTVYVDKTVNAAFMSLKRELDKSGRHAVIEKHRYWSMLSVRRDDVEEFRYAVRARAYRRADMAFPELQRPDEPRSLKAEVFVRGVHTHEYAMADFNRDAVIENFLQEYAKWMGW